jgi:multisubunit Na+/H+ antiporter MnhG subunit
MTWPALFTPLAKLWFGFSHLLGSVTTKIILTAIFMLVVVPVAIMRRAMGADAMRCKGWKGGAVSAFIEREHTYSKEDLDSPY